MNTGMDLTTLLFLAAAVFIFLRLRSVLGRKIGHERPPGEPYIQRDGPQGRTDDNVVPLPNRNGDGRANGPAGSEAPVVDRLKGIAQPGTPVAAGLSAIMAADTTFEPNYFIGGAKGAYEIIVTAFAQGDRKSLKPLLSKEVFDGFAGALDQREQAGQTVASSFVGIDKAEIVEAALKATSAHVTVRFVSKLIQSTKNANGAIIDGDPSRVMEVTDIWTFARDVSERDPNWRLVATEAA